MGGTNGSGWVAGNKTNQNGKSEGKSWGRNRRGVEKRMGDVLNSKQRKSNRYNFKKKQVLGFFFFF